MGWSDLLEKAFVKKKEEHFVIEMCHGVEEKTTSSYELDLSALYILLEGEVTEDFSSLLKITSLDLSNCSLSELPKCLQILHLKDFNISKNSFKQVPSCLYNGLEEIERLDMSFNSLRSFDIEPDCVLSLKVLKLNNNSFKNVPLWFLTFRCINLEHFNYNENYAEHYRFLKNSSNHNLIKLRELKLKNSCLLDTDLLWLKCFKFLEYLDISNKSICKERQYINKFKELDLLFVNPHWTNIKVLRLNFLDISICPDGIFWVNSLKELYINNNLISWFPDGIEYLANLEVLDVSNNQLICLPEEIAQLRKLKFLFASENVINELPCLPKNLEVLDLYENHLHVADYQNLVQIEKLDLELNFIGLEDESDINYREYCIKRDNFRCLYSCTDRSLGFKIKEGVLDYETCTHRSLGLKIKDNISVSDYDTTDDESSDFESSNFGYGNNENYEIPQEDWDEEILRECVFKHPDITLSDHEYDGEKEDYFKINFANRPKIYISEEDILFIDAD